jgi:hypothetical protein
MFRSFLERLTPAAAPISALIEGICRVMVLVVVVLSAARSAPAADEELKPEAYRPQWTVGQRWVIASVTLQSQARRNPQPDDSKQAVRWQFDVRKIEKVDDRNCFQVEVKCLDGEGEAITTLWVDEKTMTLRRAQTQLPVAGGLRTITENYRSASGQPFPAFTPLTVPPLELPLFLTGTKGSQTFEYAASSTPPEEKGVGDIEFAFSVEQQLTRPPADKIKGLVPEEYSKDLIQKPVLEVQLKAASSQVRQLWQPGLPWPVYSNNGIAESRLVDVVEPAKNPEESKDKTQP